MLLTFSPTLGRAQSTARAGSRKILPSHRMSTPSKANTSTHRKTAKSSYIGIAQSYFHCRALLLGMFQDLRPSVIHGHHAFQSYLLLL